MSYLKNNLKLKLTVFLLITALIFWMIPSNMIFGESDDIELLQQAVTEAQEALDAAKTAADEAATELADVQAVADSAAAALADAQNAADAASTALADAKVTDEEAKAALADAETALADAQAALDAAGEGDDIESLQQAVADAQAALDAAKTAVDEAATKLIDAQTAADAAAAALEKAKTAADEANATLANAQAALDAANAAVADAETALADAQAALDAALAALEEATPPEEIEPLGETLPVVNPVLSTDKGDYAPEETVVITGTGFLPNAVYMIVVTRPDGSVVIGDGSFTPGSDSVLSDASGNFTYNYILDGIEGTYLVEAKDEACSVVATTTFTDFGNDITVHKFGDTNGNGSQNGTEPNLFGVQFKLEIWALGWWNSGTETTDSSGNATWYSKLSGYYRITELNTPTGYEPKTNPVVWEGYISHDKTIDIANDPLGCEDVEVKLSATHQGANSATFTPDIPGDNGGITTPGVVWHFILNGLDSDTTPPATIYGEFVNAGSFSVVASNDGKTQHFWVWTPTDDILVYAGTNYVYALVDSCGYNNLVLSHVCHNGTAGKIIVNKNVFAPNGTTDVSDSHTFTVTLQKSNSRNGTYHDISTKTFSEGSPAVWEDLELDKWYRAVEEHSDSYVEFYNTGKVKLEGSGDVEEILIKNKQKLGSIEVNKDVRKANGSNTSDHHHFWVELYVQNDSGGWDLVPGTNPKEFWEGHNAVFGNLLKGRIYKAVELDEPGYTLWSNDGPKELACDVVIHIVNRQCPKGSITVTKEGLEGSDQAKLYLWDTNGTPGTGDDNLVDTAAAPSPQTVSNGGTASWGELPYGDYYIVEDFNGITNVYTYSVGNPVANITVGGDESLTIENTAEKGSIEIFKTDATTGLPLGGSTFELYKWGSWNLISTVVLGADGHYKWEDLPYGLYKVVETIAPTGYLLAPPVEVTLDSETPNVVLKKEIADPRIPGKVTIIKRDESGATLDGAGFTLYYKDSGNPVMPERFTSGGMVTFDGLGWGTYIISETTVPGGFNKAGDVEVTIGPSNAEAGVAVTITNTKTPPPPTPPSPPTTTTTGGGIQVLGIQELPFTGMNPVIPISGVSTIFAGGLMVVLSTIRRRFRRK